MKYKVSHLTVPWHCAALEDLLNNDCGELIQIISHNDGSLTVVKGANISTELDQTPTFCEGCQEYMGLADYMDHNCRGQGQGETNND